MKLKFQQGGALLSLPFAVYQPFILPNESAQTSSKSKESQSKKKNELIDFMDKILGNLQGLPGDKQAMIGTLSSIFTNMEYKLNNPDMFGGTGSIANEYLQALNYVSNLRFQHDAFIKAKETATNKGSLHEVAINSVGQIMAASEDGFEWITPEQFAENQELYRPITNSELLTLRAQGTGGLVFDQASIDTVSNGMGIGEVTKLIQDALTNLGTDTQKNNGYIGVNTGELIKGLEEYTNALQKSGKYNSSVEDLYEIGLLTESQAKQAKMAMSYIYNTLPVTAKTLLKMKSNGQDTGAEALVGTLINSKLKSKNEFDPKLVGGPVAKASGKSGDKDESKMKNTFLIDLIKNEGGSEVGFKFDVGEGIVLTANGRMHSGIVDATNHETLGSGNFEELFLKSGMQNIINDQKAITFGDQKISRTQFKKLVYDNTGVLRTNLPIKNDGTVDIEILDRYKQAEDDLKLTNKTREDYLRIYKKHDIEFLLMPNGEKNESKFGPFVVMEASTTSENGIKKSKYIREIEDPSEEDIDIVEKSLSDKENPYVIDEFNLLNPADWFDNYDTYYKGLVFIPVNPNVVSALHGSGQEIDYEEARSQDEKYSNFNKMIRQQNNSNSILNNN